MRVLKLLLLIVFITKGSFAQIYFSNPMMEGSPLENTPPSLWNICTPTPDTQPINLIWYPWCLIAHQGLTYLGLQTDSNFIGEYHEAAGQFISCSLVPFKNNSFKLWLYENLNYQLIAYHYGAVCQLYGGFNQCELDTLLWQSPVLDSTWQEYEIDFIPNKPYTYLTFKANNFNAPGFNTQHSYIGIDALSEITVQGFNFFSFPNTDTTINKGACVSFTATSDDTAATFYWSTTAGDSVATADSINVCPTTTTTYVCTATLGCGQQFKDSVTITVLGGGSSGTPIIKIPNLLSADDPTWQIINLQSGTSVTIYNTLGQLVYKRKEYNNTLNINELAAATYFYEVKYGSQTFRGKLIIIR